LQQSHGVRVHGLIRSRLAADGEAVDITVLGILR
jgi:hypothetical protein